MSDKEQDADPKAAHNALEMMQLQYRFGGITLMIVWTACAIGSLATYKPHRIVHNSIGVMQALTALPLIWAATSSLSNAAKAGWDRLRLVEFRRLNLALAAACVWSAITVIWAPSFTAAVVRTSDPVTYAPPLRAMSTIAYLGMAALCVDTWTRSIPPPADLWRVVDGFLGSLFRFSPPLPSSSSSLDGGFDPQRPYANAYGFLSLAFAVFTAVSLFATFPLATVPSLLGKRMARAFGAWTFLCAVFLFILKDHAVASVARPLRAALLLFSSSHLCVALARPLLESATVYPAALSCKPAVVASYLVYLLLFCTALRDRASKADKAEAGAGEA